MGCLAEDELLALTRGGGLAAAPAVEAHLGACPACSAVVAALVDDGERAEVWDALAGTSVGPYRLEAQLGAGAMGAVYRGWDTRLERWVAVKLLAGAGDARRLEVEARAAAAIAHPNVVAVHDVGDDGGRAYVVSELVDGESLRAVIARGPVPIDRVARLALELARGLAAAHAAGIVHRDLKPENVLVTRDGVLKILDFGLAKRVDRPGGLDATVPGTVFGTVGYMAPEQARGEPVDGRADLFAAGAILYELATGRRAFDGASHAERLTAVLRDPPPDDAALGALAPIVSRCLAKDAGARFQSAADLVWVIEELPRGDRSEGRVGGVSRRGVLLGGAAVIATGAAGFLLGRRRHVAGVAPSPRVEQLTFRQGRVWSGRFARDGASIFYGAAWDGEAIAAQVLRLDGGTSRALELPSADVLAVSSTALAIGIDRRHVDGQCATGRLALAPIDGGVPRILAEDVQEADFGPDGELAAIVRTARGFRLEWPLGEARVDGPRWLTHPRISPDGKRIAFLRHPHANDDAGELVVIDREANAETTISAGWSSIAGLAWSARGDTLWFTASPDGAGSALRSIAPRAGARDRVRFQTLGRLRLHDVHGDRRMLVSRDAWRLRTMLGGARPDVDRSLTEFSLVAGFSPDGASLLVGELGDTPDVNGVYVVPAGGGPRLRLGPGLPLAWSRDGAHVIAIGFDPVTQTQRTARYATHGGERTPVDVGAIARVRWASWIDHRRLVIGGDAAGRPPRLWRLAVDGGVAPMTDEGDHGEGAVDPGARRVAYVDAGGVLRVLPLDGGAAIALGRDLADHVVCGWRDDAAILVRTTTTPVDVLAIDATTGAVGRHARIEPPAVGLKGVDAVAIHPATGAHAYSYGQELSELFLVAL